MNHESVSIKWSGKINSAFSYIVVTMSFNIECALH